MWYKFILNTRTGDEVDYKFIEELEDVEPELADWAELIGHYMSEITAKAEEIKFPPDEWFDKKINECNQSVSYWKKQASFYQQLKDDGK